MNKAILIIFIDFIILSLLSNTLSISYDEAVIFYDKNNISHYLTIISSIIFGQNDYAIRLPSILIHCANAILIFKIGGFYLKKESDKLLLLILYLILPGTNSVALLVNESGLIILFSLIFIYLFKKFDDYALGILIFYPFIDNAFIVFLLAISIFYIAHKKYYQALFCFFLFSFSFYLYGFDMSGIPKGYFIDIIGIYAAIFSPPFFIYYFYILYRILIKDKKKDLIWFIAFNSLVFSLLLSFRQKINVQDFAPFTIVALPLAVKTFLHSYRTYLPRFRKKFKIIFSLCFGFLLINLILISFNKALYPFFKDPSKHFAYEFNIAKDLAKELKKRNIRTINVQSMALQKRLRFYGIQEGGELILRPYILDKIKDEITIKYYGKEVAWFFIH